MKAILILATTLSLGTLAQTLNDQERPSMSVHVYKTASCGCCVKWINLLKDQHFIPAVTDEADITRVKDKYGVPKDLRSCHTAIVGSYVFEGHVPIDLIVKVISEKPKISGLAVAGMPVGSPGMEVAGRRDPYNVVAFTRDGQQSVYASR